MRQEPFGVIITLILAASKNNFGPFETQAFGFFYFDKSETMSASSIAEVKTNLNADDFKQG